MGAGATLGRCVSVGATLEVVVYADMAMDMGVSDDDDKWTMVAVDEGPTGVGCGCVDVAVS
jgi:hypothetical protein